MKRKKLEHKLRQGEKNNQQRHCENKGSFYVWQADGQTEGGV